MCPVAAMPGLFTWLLNTWADVRPLFGLEHHCPTCGLNIFCQCSTSADWYWTWSRCLYLTRLRSLGASLRDLHSLRISSESTFSAPRYSSVSNEPFWMHAFHDNFVHGSLPSVQSDSLRDVIRLIQQPASCVYSLHQLERLHVRELPESRARTSSLPILTQSRSYVPAALCSCMHNFNNTSNRRQTPSYDQPCTVHLGDLLSLSTYDKDQCSDSLLWNVCCQHWTRAVPYQSLYSQHYTLSPDHDLNKPAIALNNILPLSVEEADNNTLSITDARLWHAYDCASTENQPRPYTTHWESAVLQAHTRLLTWAMFSSGEVDLFEQFVKDVFSLSNFGHGVESLQGWGAHMFEDTPEMSDIGTGTNYRHNSATGAVHRSSCLHTSHTSQVKLRLVLFAFSSHLMFLCLFVSYMLQAGSLQYSVHFQHDAYTVVSRTALKQYSPLGGVYCRPLG